MFSKKNIISIMIMLILPTAAMPAVDVDHGTEGRDLPKDDVVENLKQGAEKGKVRAAGAHSDPRGKTLDHVDQPPPQRQDE